MVAMVAMVVGCGEDSPANVSRTKIGPDGGQAGSHDGVLTIFVPAGALTKTVTVEISPSDEPPAIFGPAYRVRPDIPLKIDADVTYHRLLPNDPGGADVAAIRVEDYAAGRGRWIALSRIELDVENDVVTATDTELAAFYGLLEDARSNPTGGLDDSSDSDGDGTGSGDTGSADTRTSDATDTGPLSHAVDIQPIWDANCSGTGCHEQRDPPMVGDAYDVIVDKLPLSGASVPYVTPGDSADSYLMHKLDGTHLLDENQGGCGCNGNGGSMPPSGALDLDARALVRRGIDEGALP